MQKHLAVAAAVLCAGFSASAHAEFTAAINLAAKGIAPQVSIDAHGDAAFTWEVPGGHSYIQETIRSADGTLTPKQKISDTISDEPYVVMDAEGNAQFAWRRLSIYYPKFRIEIRDRTAPGVLEPTERVVQVPGGTVIDSLHIAPVTNKGLD